MLRESNTKYSTNQFIPWFLTNKALFHPFWSDVKDTPSIPVVFSSCPQVVTWAWTIATALRIQKSCSVIPPYSYDLYPLLSLESGFYMLWCCHPQYTSIQSHTIVSPLRILPKLQEKASGIRGRHTFPFRIPCSFPCSSIVELLHGFKQTCRVKSFTSSIIANASKIVVQKDMSFFSNS